MKKVIIFFLLLLQSEILPQNNFIQQITSGDFDARNPFIYKDGYGFYNDMFFELHKDGASNIYSIRYNSDTGLFGDTLALTYGNYLNINPSFNTNSGLIFQTNKNGNWDIALLPYTNGIWDGMINLTNSLSNEESPKFIESIYNNSDSINILFKRDDEIVLLTYKANQINEQVIFQNNAENNFTEFAGILIEYWDNISGIYVYAIQNDSNNIKKIVSRFRPINGDWQGKTVVKDNCDCAELSAQALNYSFWGITYQDTLNGERKLFGIDNMANPPYVSIIPIETEGNLSSFDLYALLIVGKKNLQSSSKDMVLYSPHTFVVEQSGKVKVRTDISDLGYWNTDSLIQTSVVKPNLAIGPLGSEYFRGIVVFTVWEDSVDGRIHFFGTKQHLQFGSVKNESYANNFVLYQNYPNPFNPATTIEYKLLQASDVKFNVINILGEKVFEQNFGYQTADSYKINFDGKSLPSGVYVYSIYTSENRLSRKMLLMK